MSKKTKIKSIDSRQRGMRRQNTARQTEKQKRQAERASKKYISRLRGVKDILPDEYKYWDMVLRKAEEIIAYYGFKKTEIPLLEKLSLYERSTGKQTDVVAKEMFSFIDKDGEKVALRPEGTPGLVRSYIEHGLFNLSIQPVKLYWIGNLFRREKPQSGRNRQFSQIDLEIFGEASPVVDAQLIQIAYLLLKDLQIETSVQINSIGCQVCRPEYKNKLVEYYKDRQKRKKLCPDCKKRLIKNPMRLLDCKVESCADARVEAPQIVDYLCDECREHFVKVLEYLDEIEVGYNLNPYLVRGLDYYTRTVFEFWPEDSETGRQNALGAGGRYNDLIEHMGGRPTPACGWAMGVERIILKIKENNIIAADAYKPDIFLAQLGEQGKRKAMIFFEELRHKKYKVAQNFVKDSLKAQLEMANKLGVKISLILGQKELMDSTILVRDMESGMQEAVDFKKVYEEIDKRLK